MKRVIQFIKRFLSRLSLRFKAWWYDWPVWRVVFEDGVESAPGRYKQAKDCCTAPDPFDWHPRIEFDYNEAIYYNNI